MEEMCTGVYKVAVILLFPFYCFSLMLIPALLPINDDQRQASSLLSFGFCSYKIDIIVVLKW